MPFPRRLLAAALLLGTPLLAQKGSKQPARPISTVVGIVVDSIHGGVLAGATVLLDGTTYSATTGTDGKFRFDSIDPGSYRIAVFHPLLDTLGLAIGTEPLRMGVDSVRQVVLGTPSQQAMILRACPQTKRRLGPGAIMGRVTNPDTDAPIDSARVSIVWTQVDVGKDVGVRRTQNVRQAVTDASGNYVLCGIPTGIQGTIQAERGDNKTAEVPIEMGDGGGLAFLGLRLLPRAANDTTPLTGAAVLTGRVVDQHGVVVADANISVQGARPSTKTGADGEFRLGGLPAGTRTVFVRRLGFAPQQVAVDLSATTPARVAVRLEKAVTTLGAVTVEGQYTSALKENGFTERKRMGMGRYITADDIARRQPPQITQLFNTIPGFTVDQGLGGTKIKSSRGSNGCVTFWIDRVPQHFPNADELDAILKPEQIMGMETYSPVAAPMEFKSPGESGCAVVVIWTNRNVREGPGR